MVVALTALVFAMTGAGYAATQISGGGGHLAKAAKKGRRGPPGPPGANGLNGTNGTNGTNGSPAGIVFSGRISGLPAASTADYFGAATGLSTANLTQNVVQTLSPGFPTTITSLTVSLSATPGTGSRAFWIRAGTTDTAADCLISGPTATTCSSNGGGATIPAGTDIVIHELGIGTPAAADAEFSWTAQ
jgi:hypothetical protein